MEDGGSGGSPDFLDMRLDINLATHPYEDARRFWLRWGGGLAALAIVTIGVLYIAFTGWFGARKDRALIEQYQIQIRDRDKDRADAQALMNLTRTRARVTVRSSSMTCFIAKRSPGPRCLRNWSG
jgi:hypothetical protein